MKIYSIYDEEFKPYGKVIKDFDGKEIIEVMKKINMPKEGTMYEPSIADLESCSCFKDFNDRYFGGMPCQLGMCWGYNTKLNCLEYHRDSEFNLGDADFILLLAKEDELEDMMLDTVCVKAFRVPANVLVEVYASTLHYAPCHTDASKGFRTLVALPRGTNTKKPDIANPRGEDLYMTARNKWLFAHPESPETKFGAKVGLKGDNLDIASFM